MVVILRCQETVIQPDQIVILRDQETAMPQDQEAIRLYREAVIQLEDYLTQQRIRVVQGHVQAVRQDPILGLRDHQEL